MSIERPTTSDGPRPLNTVVLLREAYTALNQLAIDRLTERGHGAVRPAHGTVFQHLDDTGTTVSTLAERARMTKQAMAELVTYLERHGYLTRRPDPSDRRAKLVTPTARGREVVAIAQQLVPEVESLIAGTIGADRADDLRRDLLALHDRATGSRP